VDYGGCKVLDMSMMPETLLPAPQYVVLDTEDETYAFSSIDKLVCKNGLFYIMDFRARKISVFDGGGKGVFAFSKNGRGPGEYLQVSDFDIDENGGFEGVVHFDFAGRTVPSEMKSSVEEHWEEFMDYSFPTKTVCPVGDDVLVGCVVEISEEGMYSDYVMDRKTKTIYKQGPESQGLFLIGMGDGKLVYMLYPGLEGDDLCPPLPQEVKDAYDAGLDVIAYRNL